MKWNKNIEAEKKDFLKKRLHEYEAVTEMTKEEQNELRKWVENGHDPLDNPWCAYGENGWPMDYIQAMREEMWLCEEMKNLTPEELAAIYQEQEDDRASDCDLNDLTSEMLIL